MTNCNPHQQSWYANSVSLMPIMKHQTYQSFQLQTRQHLSVVCKHKETKIVIGYYNLKPAVPLPSLLLTHMNSEIERTRPFIPFSPFLLLKGENCVTTPVHNLVRVCGVILKRNDLLFPWVICEDLRSYRWWYLICCLAFTLFFCLVNGMMSNTNRGMHSTVLQDVKQEEHWIYP